MEYKQKLLKFLTRKEITVLFFVVCGLDNYEVGAETNYSPSNVGTIITKIFKTFEMYGVEIEGEGMVKRQNLINEFQPDVFVLIKSEADLKKWVRIVPTRNDFEYIFMMRANDVMTKKMLKIDDQPEPEIKAYLSWALTMPPFGDPEYDGTKGMTEEESRKKFQEWDDRNTRNSEFYKKYPDLFKRLYPEDFEKLNKEKDNTTS